MKRYLTFFTLIAMTLLLLVSCGGEPEAPEGMQVVYESPEDGYVFYGPDGWTVSNRAGIAACYVSGINKTSISFAKTTLPEGVAVENYFDTVKDEFVYDITPVDQSSFGKKCNFGTDRKTVAYKYVYTFKYTDKDTTDIDRDNNVSEEIELDFTSMQIIVSHDGKLYIFTYTALGTPDNETSNYRLYLNGAQAAIDSFKFTDKSEDTSSAPEYPKDSDGYNMVSNKTLAGFELYLPEGYEVIDNSGIVSAVLRDGTTVSITKANEVGVTISEYWTARKAELSKFVTDLDVIRENVTNVKNDETGLYSSDVVFGNLELNRVALYEYTYEFGGVTYHVYQLLGWTRTDGYVFTYTAKEVDYTEHLDEIMTVIGKVRF